MLKTQNSSSASRPRAREENDWPSLLKLIPGFDQYRESAGYHFDAAAADTAVHFFPKYLVHIKGVKAGQPFVLEPWERAIVGCIFGWLDDAGLRRFREAFIYIPRGNAKPTLAAGIALLSFYCDDEPGAEVYCGAASRDNARIMWELARDMIVRNKALEAGSKRYQYSITIPGRNAAFKAISADANTQHG